MTISIPRAKEIRESLGASHLVIFTVDPDGTQHVATHGATEQNAAEAADAGNRLKSALGWPADLCQAKPEPRAVKVLPFWTASVFGSGTQVVQRGDVPVAYAATYYHVGHVTNDDEGDSGRSAVRLALCEWLNGGDAPEWLSLLRRISHVTVVLPNGCEITATGPMVDRAVPPSWGCWAQDDSDDATLARVRMTDALINGTRPTS